MPLGQSSDLYVLVLRVATGHHPRPLLVDGVAYIRHQNTTHPADWQRLHDLFAESAAARQDDLWDLHAPDLPRGSDGASDGTVDFVVRSGLDVTVTRDAQWRPLAEHTVTAFTGALNRSPLNAMLMRLAVGGAPAGGMNPFHRHGLNRSRLVRLAWSGFPDASAGGQARAGRGIGAARGTRRIRPHRDTHAGRGGRGGAAQRRHRYRPSASSSKCPARAASPLERAS